MAWGGTRWAGLQYSTPTVLCVVLCVYSARTLGGWGHGDGGGRSTVLWCVLLVYSERTLIGERSTDVRYFGMYSMRTVLCTLSCTLYSKTRHHDVRRAWAKATTST